MQACPPGRKRGAARREMLASGGGLWYNSIVRNQHERVGKARSFGL